MSSAGDSGLSFVRSDPPDILYSAFIGDISESEMRRMCIEQRQWAQTKGRFFVLLDLARLRDVSSDARKVVAAEVQDEGTLGIGVFGASFKLRVLATLITKAVSLLKRRSPPLRFFDTEGEARAWFDEVRADIAAKQR